VHDVSYQWLSWAGSLSALLHPVSSRNFIGKIHLSTLRTPGTRYFTGSTVHWKYSMRQYRVFWVLPSFLVCWPQFRIPNCAIVTHSKFAGYCSSEQIKTYGVRLSTVFVGQNQESLGHPRLYTTNRNRRKFVGVVEITGKPIWMTRGGTETTLENDVPLATW